MSCSHVAFLPTGVLVSAPLFVLPLGGCTFGRLVHENTSRPSHGRPRAGNPRLWPKQRLLAVRLRVRATQLVERVGIKHMG